ncbi:hypothetical protein [Parasphingorhabdus sp.]|uniref:hypothetical protein n=1 Tax=Parasphingorhabdus sp. TaxID=2709688 RepID=UPI0032668DC9
MSNKRTVFTEAALVAAVLTVGISAAEAARAAPIAASMQSAPDPRANIKIESRMQVERTETDASGTTMTKLYAPADVKVVPGDKLIIINAYRNTGATPVTGFVINNPVHSAVSFTEVSQKWAVVSVDNGVTFGQLGNLTVSTPAAAGTPISRPALPSDVTHIRWVFTDAIASGQSGELSFRGTVK